MNLRKMLHISDRISSACERGEAVAAISTADFFACTSPRTTLSCALSSIQECGCTPAVLYISRGQLCIDDSVDVQMLQSSAGVGLSELALALARGDIRAVCADAAVMMASLVGIRAVSAAYAFGKDSCGAEPCISALRAYPTLLAGCASLDALSAFTQRGVPAYKAQRQAPDGNAEEYLPLQDFAQICRVKWDLGLTSGVAAICDYCEDTHEAYIRSAVTAAGIAAYIHQIGNT